MQSQMKTQMIYNCQYICIRILEEKLFTCFLISYISIKRLRKITDILYAIKTNKIHFSLLLYFNNLSFTCFE